MPSARAMTSASRSSAQVRVPCTERSGTRSRSIGPGVRFSTSNGPATASACPGRSSGPRSACARSCIEGTSVSQSEGSNDSMSATSRASRTGSNSRKVALARARAAASSARRSICSRCSEPVAATCACTVRFSHSVASSRSASAEKGVNAPSRSRPRARARPNSPETLVRSMTSAFARPVNSTSRKTSGVASRAPIASSPMRPCVTCTSIGMPIDSGGGSPVDGFDTHSI